MVAGGSLLSGLAGSQADAQEMVAMPGMKHEGGLPKPIGDAKAERPSGDRDSFDGYSRYKPFEHIYRHHRRYRITEGADEIQIRRAAGYLFGFMSQRKPKGVEE